MHYKTQKNIIKIILFIVLMMNAVLRLNKIIRPDREDRFYISQQGFYNEPKNSLQAVFIGSSSTYMFFQPALAYRNHRLRTYTLTATGMNPVCIKYWLMEAHKRQPDALFVINLTDFVAESRRTSVGHMYRSTNDMRFSITKLRMIRELKKKYNASYLELFFPFYVFHSEWNNSESLHIDQSFPRFMGSAMSSAFDLALFTRICSFDGYVFNDNVQAEYIEHFEILDDLFDTIENLNVPVLFYIAPQIDHPQEIQTKTLEEYCIRHGYTVINMNKIAHNIGINPTTDYFNESHTNIHGAVKVTDAVSCYLIETFPEIFVNREPDSDWDQVEKRYGKYIKPYILDFEYDAAPQTAELMEPKNFTVDIFYSRGVLKWEAVPGAEGYAIFGKTPTGNWDRLAELPADKTNWTDPNMYFGFQYTYTVVPFCSTEREIEYGRWNVLGVSVDFPPEDVEMSN